MKLFKNLLKPSKQVDFSPKLRRKARNKRYYLKHKAEIQQKRKEYYSLTGK